MKRLAVANWKLNPQNIEKARLLASQVEHGLLSVDRTVGDVVICPPFVFLPPVRLSIHFARLGVQNISAEEQGPFTGEVSAIQVLEYGVQYVILGHSERRAMGEDDKLINRKIKVALKYKLEPIVCVGFGTKKSSKDEAIKKIIRKQLRLALAGVDLKKTRFTIVYEPVWAISRGLGTGRAVTPAHASLIISFIQGLYRRIRVIYGGSLDAKNAPAFAAKKNILGGLVGGASLDPFEFIKIVKSFLDH